MFLILIYINFDLPVPTHRWRLPGADTVGGERSGIHDITDRKCYQQYRSIYWATFQGFISFGWGNTWNKNADIEQSLLFNWWPAKWHCDYLNISWSNVIIYQMSWETSCSNWFACEWIDLLINCTFLHSPFWRCNIFLRYCFSLWILTVHVRNLTFYPSGTYLMYWQKKGLNLFCRPIYIPSWMLNLK